MPNDDTIFISLGHRCSSAGVIDHCRLPRASVPFDSIVCQLPVVKDCLQNGFGAFLDPANYVRMTTVTVDIVDDVFEFWGNETPSVNRHYRDAAKPDSKRPFIERSTYHQQLALTHHDLSSADDRDAFARRAARPLDLLARDRRKVYVYIHPVMGMDDLQRERSARIDLFTDFSEFMRGRSGGTFGLFFALVRSDDDADDARSVALLQSPACAAYAIHANRQFIDAGGPFSGDCAREIRVIARIIEAHNV